MNPLYPIAAYNPDFIFLQLFQAKPYIQEDEDLIFRNAITPETARSSGRLNPSSREELDNSRLGAPGSWTLLMVALFRSLVNVLH